MATNQIAAVLLSACPDCGAFVTDQSWHREGWYKAECGRRYHRDRDHWEPMAPTGCLHRQIDQLKEMKIKFCKMVIMGKQMVNVPGQMQTTLNFESFEDQLSFTRARALAEAILDHQDDQVARLFSESP